jgi:chromosome segregation ATPase
VPDAGAWWLDEIDRLEGQRDDARAEVERLKASGLELDGVIRRLSDDYQAEQAEVERLRGRVAYLEGVIGSVRLKADSLLSGIDRAVDAASSREDHGHA